jgi:PleD family two-component response regulator
MTEVDAAGRTPLVLLVNNQEWTARSVESVLRPTGYAVVKAYTGRQATELAARLRPDLVFVDYRLSDVMGLDACRAIRELPTVDSATPFIIATAADLSRQERHECYQAGIWDIFSAPFDAVELIAKLETYLSARRHAEQAWEFTHQDPATGLYNWNGLVARAMELIADARRSKRWTACVAVGPAHVESSDDVGESPRDPSHEPAPDAASDMELAKRFDRLAAALHETTRDSDSAGILGTNDFLVLAPGTDEEGAAILARRLVEAINAGTSLTEDGGSSGLKFSAGYYSARDRTGGGLVAEDLLGRTMEALRAAQRGEKESRVVLPFHSA